MQVRILFNALPKIPLPNSKTNVALILDFVLVDDVEDHEIVLVHKA